MSNIAVSRKENWQKQLLDQSNPHDPNLKTITYETQTQVHHDLQYYIDHEDMGLGGLYQVYEEAYIKVLELYKPKTYQKQIEYPEGSGSLYIGEIGVCHKKLNDDDLRNYLDEIVIGIASVSAVVAVRRTTNIFANSGSVRSV
ncbi:MAG: hypothetical protein ACK5KR_04200 [Breznakia sp.]